jgi:hypothetical protein
VVELFRTARPIPALETLPNVVVLKPIAKD